MNDFQSLFDISDIAKVAIAVSSLAPGFLIAFVRSAFITGRIKLVSETMMEYVVASAIYYSFAAPIFFSVSSFSWFNVFLLLFGAPALLGLAAGVTSQKGVIGKLFGCLGLKIAHPMPTSWDFLFGNLKSGSWVVVTLKNHERVFGFFGGASFAASDLSRRDLFIEDIRDSNWGQIEKDGRARGLWVSEEEICMVEIITDEVKR